jgi:hypothetical protein
MVLVDYPYIGQHVDVAVFLEGMTFTDNANDPLEDGSRQVIFKLEFIAQYWLYGPSGSTLEVLVNKMIEDKLGIPETNTPQVVKATKKTTIRIHSEIDRFYLSDNADLVISMDPTGKTVIEL